MKKSLMNKELAILSDILKVDVDLLTQIRGVLDVKKVRRMLIEKNIRTTFRKKVPKETDNCSVDDKIRNVTKWHRTHHLCQGQ